MFSCWIFRDAGARYERRLLFFRADSFFRRIFLPFFFLAFGLFVFFVIFLASFPARPTARHIYQLATVR